MKTVTKTVTTFFARRFGNNIMALSAFFNHKWGERGYTYTLYIEKGYFLPRMINYSRNLSHSKNMVTEMVTLSGEEIKNDVSRNH